jgi:hypothetical protein
VSIVQNRVGLLDDIIAIRLTTTARDLPTWVKLSSVDPLAGYANADCIEQRSYRRKPPRRSSTPLPDVCNEFQAGNTSVDGAMPSWFVEKVIGGPA